MTRARAAFSLIEVMIVVAIIAIAASIALPRFSQASQNYRLSLAAQRVISDLAMAQARADNSSSPVTVTFDAAAGSYQILGLASLDRPASPYVVRLGDGPYNVTLSSVTFAGQPLVAFDGYGIPSSPGTIVLAVGQLTRTVSVEGTSGRAATP